MAFKGTWHRADGGAGGSSNDRRYGSSNDSFSSFVLTPQVVPGNQMGLQQMNYQTNPNSMYSVMNTGASMMTSTNYQSQTKSSQYVGTVSNMYRDFGVIDNEISFKINGVKGPLPHIGDRVVCQMKPAEGFGAQTPYKYCAFDVQSVQPQNETRRPMRPAGGNVQQMSRNSDSYMNRNQNRNQATNVKRTLPNNNNNKSNNNNHSNNNSNNHNTDTDRHANNNRDRHGPVNNGSANERRRPTPVRRSGSRSSKVATSKQVPRGAPPPKYNCTLPKSSLDCSELSVVQVRSRYSRLHIPSDFYHASYAWHQSIPLDHPLKFVMPCSFHVFNKNVPRLTEKSTATLDPPDADYSWNVRVVLMSSPDIQTLISRSCLIKNGHSKSLVVNPDDLEHPTKLIKFLVGVRYQNEYFALGGPWSESLDGPDPDNDPQVLIRTAVRCVQAQTSIDLSKCIQWCRYLEVRYHRPEEVHKGRLIPSRVENIIVFLPDIAAACMPSSLDWEETSSAYKQASSEEIAEELNEANICENDVESRGPTHHSSIDVDKLRTMDLRIELKARGQAMTGIKVDLKNRLTKVLQQEKLNEEKNAANPDGEQQTTNETGPNPIKVDIKEHSPSEIDKMRKDIEAKYQLPAQRSILVHPTTLKADKFDCRVVSLHYLLNYANKDTIKEKCFELYLFAEAFNEMLMRDSSYCIYRSLCSCLEITEANVEMETEPNENPTEQNELMIVIDEDTPLPGLDLNTDDNEKKRKRTPSEEDESSQRKKTTPEETNEPSAQDEPKSSPTSVQTRPRTVHSHLLLAFTFFDRNRCGYLLEKDLEEVLLISGLSLTKNEAKLLVSRVAHNEKIHYHKLTDKVLPIDDSANVDMNEADIDPQAPKGNLLSLPRHLSVFGLRSTNDKIQLTTSVDNQRVIKQLEISNKIQTGLELKIDGLKKEIHKLTDELHSTQKTSRNYSDQLSDTKKRLRDTQHDLKEIEEKYKRYSDALYRIRSESRSTFDNLTHVLAIKEKQPSQTRKSEDETKKVKSESKATNDNEKPKPTEKPAEQEPTVQVEESVPVESNETAPSS